MARDPTLKDIKQLRQEAKPTLKAHTQYPQETMLMPKDMRQRRRGLLLMLKVIKLTVWQTRVTQRGGNLLPKEREVTPKVPKPTQKA